METLWETPACHDTDRLQETEKRKGQITPARWDRSLIKNPFIIKEKSQGLSQEFVSLMEIHKANIYTSLIDYRSHYKIYDNNTKIQRKIR